MLGYKCPLGKWGKSPPEKGQRIQNLFGCAIAQTCAHTLAHSHTSVQVGGGWSCHSFFLNAEVTEQPGVPLLLCN